MRRSKLSWILAGLAVGLGLARLGLLIDDAGGPGNIARLSVPVSDASTTPPARS